MGRDRDPPYVHPRLWNRTALTYILFLTYLGTTYWTYSLDKGSMQAVWMQQWFIFLKEIQYQTMRTFILSLEECSLVSFVKWKLTLSKARHCISAFRMCKGAPLLDSPLSLTPYWRLGGDQGAWTPWEEPPPLLHMCTILCCYRAQSPDNISLSSEHVLCLHLFCAYICRYCTTICIYQGNNKSGNDIVLHLCLNICG
jgi:hypothetical protein